MRFAGGTRNFCSNRAQVSVQTHTAAEIVEHAIEPRCVQKLTVKEVFPMRAFFRVKIKDQCMFLPGRNTFHQSTGRILTPGLQDPNSVGVTVKQRLHDDFADSRKLHCAGFAALMEGIGCKVNGVVAEYFFLTVVKHLGKPAVTVGVGAQHSRAFKPVPEPL